MLNWNQLNCKSCYLSTIASLYQTISLRKVKVRYNFKKILQFKKDSFLHYWFKYFGHFISSVGSGFFFTLRKRKYLKSSLHIYVQSGSHSERFLPISSCSCEALGTGLHKLPWSPAIKLQISSASPCRQVGRLSHLGHHRDQRCWHIRKVWILLA